jgi:hypothetical protein
MGALLLTFLRDFLSSVLIHVYPILVGAVLIISIIFFPKGIVGSIRAWQRGRALAAAPAPRAPPALSAMSREAVDE